MSRAEKLLQKIKNNPKTVPFHDLDRVLIGHGFTRRIPRSGSSHTIYALGQHQISVPYKRPYVREVYVRHVLEILDQIDEEKGEQR